MRRIAFINEKGGTCKTTLAVNVASYLALEKGQRVLLCDLDTQGHAGKSLGVDVRELSLTAYELLVDPALPLSSVVRPTAVEGLWLLPSNKAMAEFPSAVATLPDRAERLRRKLSAAEGRYDFLLFDSPPSLGVTTQNILLAASEVVVPVALSYLSLDGCAEVLQTVERTARERQHPDLAVTLVVPTLYRKTALADAILQKLREHFPDKVAMVALGYDVKIDESQSHGQTIWEYAPKGKGARALKLIAEEILERRASGRAEAAAAAR